MGGENLRLDIPTPNAYGAPESPQSQTAPLFSSGTSTPVLAGYASSRSSTQTFSAQHMKVPIVGMTGAMPAQSEISFSSKYSLSPDPARWDSHMLNEPDDELHRPDPRRDRKLDSAGTLFTARGIVNLGCLIILALGLISLFAVYPMVSYLVKRPSTTLGGYNLGGVNASGQVPEMGNFGLIDNDTPESAYYHTSLNDGSEWELVFSDEFNADGRSFYPGDDPYWEAVDLHYWGTNNLEWYSPDMITTNDGKLNITLARQKWRGMDYKGGMITSWNKFCFTGGYFVANVSLPGTSKVYGLWPAMWALGNLGRAGYGASLDGTWPYSYDTCDVGTLPNQTRPDGTPINATINGDKYNGDVLSYLPGQRLSACTCEGGCLVPSLHSPPILFISCPPFPLSSHSKPTTDPTHPGESHPGPKRKSSETDGKGQSGGYVGRAAPEIDVLEATVDAGTLIGHVSQSGQWAPFNYAYEWWNSTDNYKLFSNHSELNSYVGGVYQQSTSGLSITNQDCYSQGGGCYSVYGFEYIPGYNGYILWTNDNEPAWMIKSAGLAEDPRVEIGPRPVPVEPMYMIFNLGISPNFGAIDWDHLQFPTWMLVDWVRVYQPKGSRNVGCDPEGFPTAEYINTYIEAYTNPNLTTWIDDYGQVKPKNRLVDGCT
ncbi:Glycoside hydrolase family 16 protein [Rhizoctonia solani]|uniref:Glycoside hydrolase family 16 protein n=1 Tax=Rhizoctonia solani TaxID=456999 RepID=A0A8H7LPD0_9AGAM|nr:Glycoside hydrolase family 16 protein [Rhizoctonia solani]